jgi:5-methylcytosine-specific restriction endonuclease McrA
MIFRKPNTSCVVCKTQIYRRPAQIAAGNVYCSSACVGKHQQKEKTCPVCKERYVGARRTCSRSCANKSRAGIKYNGTRPRDKAYQGTILKTGIAQRSKGTCERCGHDNYAILQVHHIRERMNGGTDDPDNLELLCPNCHATHHYGSALYGEK